MAKASAPGGEHPRDPRPAARPDNLGGDGPHADDDGCGEEVAPKPVDVDEDPLVTELVGPDPCVPPNVWVVRGFPGKTCWKCHLRLYLTPELDEYLEIPKDAVRNAVQCDQECAGLGGIMLWIDRGASVQHVRTREVRAPAGILRRGQGRRAPWSEADWEDGDPGEYSKRC